MRATKRIDFQYDDSQIRNSQKKYPSQSACAREIGSSESLLSNFAHRWRDPNPEQKKALSRKLGARSMKFFQIKHGNILEAAALVLGRTPGKPGPY